MFRWLLLFSFVTPAFADDAPKTDDVDQTERRQVLDKDFLQRIPVRPMPMVEVQHRTWDLARERFYAEPAWTTQELRAAYTPRMKDVQETTRNDRGERARRFHHRVDRGLNDLPTGRTVEGVLALVPGTDTRFQEPWTVFLDGAQLQTREARPSRAQAPGIPR